MLRSVVVAVLLSSAGLLAAPADTLARDRDERRERREEPRHERHDRNDRAHRGDRSAAAARRAQAQNGGGRVLSVEPDAGGYRVKVLKDGEVRTHHVGED